MLDKKKRWNGQRIHKYILVFLDFQFQYAGRALQYIMTIFVITGIFRFNPDMLDYVFPKLEIDTTLQECWWVLFPVVVTVDILYRAFHHVYHNANQIYPPLKSVVAAIIGTMLVFSTGFDGDRMLLTYAFWWMIKLFSWGILKKNDYIMANNPIIGYKASPPMGTAVCVEKIKMSK